MKTSEHGAHLPPSFSAGLLTPCGPALTFMHRRPTMCKGNIFIMVVHSNFFQAVVRLHTTNCVFGMTGGCIPRMKRSEDNARLSACRGR